MKKMRILTVSSANMDFVMNVTAIPAAGQTVIDDGVYKYVPGGKGANSATTFARLGASSVFCTRLGRDAHADTLMRLYESENIDTSFITVDDEDPTGLASIFVEKDGSNRIIVFPGANMKIKRETIEAAFNSKDAPDALYLQLEISHEANLAAAQIAAGHGVPVFMDAGPADKTFPLSDLPRLEIFSPNETETELFTGICPTEDGMCLAAATALAKLVDAKYYVIKLGRHGCAVYDGKDLTVLPSYKVKAVDTTAAGDAFTAALVLEYLRSKDIIRAAKYANAAGAVTVSRAGASTSLPTAEDVEKFLSDGGIII